MVILNAKKVEYKEPVEGMDYIIVRAELTKNEQYGESVKVALEPVDKEENDANIYNAGLWVSETYTPKSKFGCFVVAFEEYYEGQKDVETNPQNITLWEGYIFRTLSWESKNNKIKILKRTSQKKIDVLQKELDSKRSKD